MPTQPQQVIRRLNIFISSPGDVQEERKLALQVIESINRLPMVRDRCVLMPLRYEDFVPAIIGQSPQAIVDQYMMQARQSDIFICIMWHRMGTPVHKEDTGEVFQSGTEYEFMDAYRAYQAEKSPRILLYRDQRPYPMDVDTEQLGRVNRFFERFTTANSGYTGLFRQFKTLDEFRDVLLQDLLTVLQELIGGTLNLPPDLQTAPTLSWDDLAKRMRGFTEKMGARYREKYDAATYVPRQSAVEHFRRFLDSDRIVTVVTGKAGTGKSSFVRGLIDSKVPDALIWLLDCTHPGLEAIHEQDIDTYIARSLELPIDRFLDAYDAIPMPAGGDPPRVILIFDAVNEFKERHLLMTRLADFVTRIGTTAIKVIITCRVPAWNALSKDFAVSTDREYHAAGPNSYISLDAFSESELPQVYEGYRKQFELKSDYSDLQPQVIRFISQPLFMKLTAVAYRGESIPRRLMLKEVFAAYVEACLGEAGIDGPEFQVLRRAIELMYDNAQRELKLALLSQDQEVGQYVQPELDASPYTHLVESGLLSQIKSGGASLLRKIEMVFVTYERVFEFLLAEIVCGEVTPEQIVEMLDLARSKSFVQLRGAAELALSFAIINGALKPQAIVQIARMDRPDSRQFLADVLHTIYESGEHRLASDLVRDLIKDESLSARQLALHVTYQLRLDAELVNLAFSADAMVRDAAVLYIYQIWNRLRLAGRLDEGYAVVRLLTEQVGITRPRALSALISLTVNLLVHIIDSPESLLPLLEIYQEMLRRFGLGRREDQNFFSRLYGNVAEGIVGALAQVTAFLFTETPLGNDRLNEEYFNDPKTKRALVDVGTLLDLPNLIGHEDKLARLILWPHPLVHFANLGTMIHFLYRQPETHLPLMQSIFDQEYSYRFRVKFDVLNAMTYSAVCRIRGGLSIPEGYFTRLEENFEKLWKIAHEIPEGKDQTWLQLDAAGDKTFFEREGVMSVKRALRQGVLNGLFTIEAHQQRTTFKVASEFLPRFMGDPENHLDALDVTVLIGSLEQVAYQGLPEFAVRTILDERVRFHWKDGASDGVVQSLANIRAFYQETVDNLLLEDAGNRPLWDRVRSVSGTPDIRELFLNNWNLWMIASSIQWIVLKMLGVAAFELAFSKKVTDLFSRLIHTSLTALFDYDVVNVGYAEWHLAHNPNWDNWEKWGIPRDIMTVKPEEHAYYRKAIQEFIAANGRGMLYEESGRPQS